MGEIIPSKNEMVRPRFSAFVLRWQKDHFSAISMKADANTSTNLGWSTLWYGIWLLIFAIVLIVLTRLAYKKGTSKGWDILFLVFGILECNIFYVLGGIFGLVARD